MGHENTSLVILCSCLGREPRPGLTHLSVMPSPLEIVWVHGDSQDQVEFVAPAAPTHGFHTILPLVSQNPCLWAPPSLTALAKPVTSGGRLFEHGSDADSEATLQLGEDPDDLQLPSPKPSPERRARSMDDPIFSQPEPEYGPHPPPHHASVAVDTQEAIGENSSEEVSAEVDVDISGEDMAVDTALEVSGGEKVAVEDLDMQEAAEDTALDTQEVSGVAGHISGEGEEAVDVQEGEKVAVDKQQVSSEKAAVDQQKVTKKLKVGRKKAAVDKQKVSRKKAAVDKQKVSSEKAAVATKVSSETAAVDKQAKAAVDKQEVSSEAAVQAKAAVDKQEVSSEAAVQAKAAVDKQEAKKAKEGSAGKPSAQKKRKQSDEERKLTHRCASKRWHDKWVKKGIPKKSDAKNTALEAWAVPISKPTARVMDVLRLFSNLESTICGYEQIGAVVE